MANIDYEPRRHTPSSALATEMGEGAKSGFGGAVRAGLGGTLVAAALIGLTGAWVISALPWVTMTSTLAILGGVGVGLASLTPIGGGLPYIIGGGLAAVAGSLGFMNGVSRGEDRVRAESMAGRQEFAHAQELSMYRQMAEARAMEAQAQMATVQAAMASQSRPQLREPRMEAEPSMATRSNTQMAQADAPSPKINAATIADMGLASMPTHQMAKA